MAAPDALSTLAARVNALIARAHQGNIKQAAERIGVPFSTLQRITAGDVANPRMAVLQSIARFYQTTIDWLVSGAGELPRLLKEATVSGPSLMWHRLIDNLELPRSIDIEVRLLPNVAPDFLSNALADPLAKRRFLTSAIDLVVIESMAPDYDVWYKRIKVMLDALGKEEMRYFLARYAEQLRPRFAKPLRAEECESLWADQVLVLGAEGAASARQYHTEAIVKDIGVEARPDVFIAPQASAKSKERVSKPLRRQSKKRV